MKYPLVSICIANYNGEQIIEECLTSVIEQSYPNIEIIVHDDCSQDDSLQVLVQFKSEITLLTSQQNMGYCESNNKMLRKAQGEFILLLNNDAVLMPNAIVDLVDEYSNDTYQILTLRQLDYNTENLIDCGCRLDKFLTPVGITEYQTQVHDIDFCHGACMFFAKKMLNEIGVFPKELESIGEDLYFCLLAKSNGYRVGCINTNSYRHHSGYSFGGGSAKLNSLSTTKRRRYLSERNRLILIIRCYPSFYKIWGGFSIMLLLVEGVLLSVTHLSLSIFYQVYYRAIQDALIMDFKNPQQFDAEMIRQFYTVPSKFKLLLKYGLPSYQS